MAAVSDHESLFSLELVVEKLYVPYVTCRFPAVAFRLLDFPTILISHVEKDLATGIKKRIDIDPYYRVPNQFAELQDKNGNFIVKKGKSCLFKIAVDSLAMHLANTPLYIMVIDEYPDVPKLLGNSSLALNEVIDNIKNDIKKNGPTVPSVHGDKGLFKIYSLMGKEIGYMIMGFRLLSLGPGLISHLPSSAFMTRASAAKLQPVQQQTRKRPVENDRQGNVIDEIIEAKVQTKSSATAQSAKRFDLNNTRDIALMTENNQCDALMQTVDMEPEKAISEKAERILKSIETQTEKRRKMPPKPQGFMTPKEESESDDEILLNPNMVLPPPLFYNSKAQPAVQIERDANAYLGYSSVFDDATVEDISGDEHIEEPVEKTREVKQKATPARTAPEQQIQDAKTIVISNIIRANSPKVQNQPLAGLNLAAFGSSEPVFPILTALLAELSKIQNPQFVSNAMQQVNQAHQAQPQGQAQGIPRSKSEEIIKDATELQESAVTSASKKRYRKSKRNVSSASEAVPKNKGWLRKAPEAGVKKTKLVFGLTNTQRLRLAKQNPNWLESAEKDEKAIKLQRRKERQKHVEPEPELETGNLSDTYTEVRRLAAKELAKATLGKSQLMTEQMTMKKTGKTSGSRDSSPNKVKDSRNRSKSPKFKKKTPLLVLFSFTFQPTCILSCSLGTVFLFFSNKIISL